jgi:hypothetical protein
VVTAVGFSAIVHDPALFVHVSHRGRTLLLLYVDDMIITGDDPEYVAFIKSHHSDQFLMPDLGPLRYFLEIEISSTFEGFFLSQENYIHDLLDRASLTNHRTAETLMELNVHLTPNDGGLLRILLIIVTLYRVLFTLVSLGLTFYTLYIFRVSLFLLPLRSTIVTFVVSRDIFVGLSLVAFSFHALALYSSRHIVMLLGLVIPLTVVMFLPIVFFLVVPSFLGRLRSS